ncbi:hypothetical protein RJT34_11670 [Clitoria ternatea]|uniref:Uncharacterized protein n=1 Tax=Clitoria ternatea TaxID=43366 RepID=A0AAN9JP09_CLITE
MCTVVKAVYQKTLLEFQLKCKFCEETTETVGAKLHIHDAAMHYMDEVYALVCNQDCILEFYQGVAATICGVMSSAAKLSFKFQHDMV